MFCRGLIASITASLLSFLALLLSLMLSLLKFGFIHLWIEDNFLASFCVLLMICYSFTLLRIVVAFIGPVLLIFQKHG